MAHRAACILLPNTNLGYFCPESSDTIVSISELFQALSLWLIIWKYSPSILLRHGSGEPGTFNYELEMCLCDAFTGAKSISVSFKILTRITVPSPLRYFSVPNVQDWLYWWITQRLMGRRTFRISNEMSRSTKMSLLNIFKIYKSMHGHDASKESWGRAMADCFDLSHVTKCQRGGFVVRKGALLLHA